jgi:hypothetical protein
VHFRRLREKVRRWDLIEYEYRIPKDDRRSESRRVQEDTIRVIRAVPSAERSALLGPVIVPSTASAAAKGQSLALIRPRCVQFNAKKKSQKEIESEQQSYREAANHGSFFDEELAELQPCPFAFQFQYHDDDNKAHTSTCDDWESAAMFRRFSERYGEQKAIELMRKTFEEDYPSKGIAFAMGTHSRYPDVWLLVGVLRLDETRQLGLTI